MKSYSPYEHKSIYWLKRQKYVPASNSLGDAKAVGWLFEAQVPLEKIKWDSSEFPNPLVLSKVIYMMENFYPNGFHPIRVDGDYNLLDGQHRVKLAQMCCFQFIDVWIDQISPLE